MDSHPPVSPRKNSYFIYFTVYEVGMGVGIRKKWGERPSLVNMQCLSQETQLEVPFAIQISPYPVERTQLKNPLATPTVTIKTNKVYLMCKVLTPQGDNRDSYQTRLCCAEETGVGGSGVPGQPKPYL